TGVPGGAQGRRARQAGRRDPLVLGQAAHSGRAVGGDDRSQPDLGAARDPPAVGPGEQGDFLAQGQPGQQGPVGIGGQPGPARRATGTWVDMMFASLVMAAFCTLGEPELAYWASAAWAGA